MLNISHLLFRDITCIQYLVFKQYPANFKDSIFLL